MCCQKFRFHLFKESEECSWSVSVKSAIDFLSWANCRIFSWKCFHILQLFFVGISRFGNIISKLKKKTAQVWTSFYICIISLATSSKKCFPLLGKNTCKVLKIQPDRVVLEIAKKNCSFFLQLGPRLNLSMYSVSLKKSFFQRRNWRHATSLQRRHSLSRPDVNVRDGLPNK